VAAYGTWGQLVGSTEEWIDDIQIDRAANGATKARAFYSAKKRRWTLKHLLTASELSALQSFYDTYRVSANTFVWSGDGTTYNVLFESAPTFNRLGSKFTEAQVRLVQQ
jgi:hypothetical protein